MIVRAAALLALAGAGWAVKRRAEECPGCGSDGFWVNLSSSSVFYDAIYTVTPWSRAVGLTLFHRELLVGHLKHVPVGLVESEDIEE